MYGTTSQSAICRSRSGCSMRPRTSSRYSAHQGDTSRILTGTVPGGGRATASQCAGKGSPRR
eukprot:16049556-Heterocapsa_arctica.AAC.1